MTIMLCERCFAPIADGEPMVRLAHIHDADADGAVSWNHTYVHTESCQAPRVPAHQRPDQGAWDSGRSVGSRRNSAHG